MSTISYQEAFQRPKPSAGYARARNLKGPVEVPFVVERPPRIHHFYVVRKAIDKGLGVLFLTDEPDGRPLHYKDGSPVLITSGISDGHLDVDKLIRQGVVSEGQELRLVWEPPEEDPTIEVHSFWR